MEFKKAVIAQNKGNLKLAEKIYKKLLIESPDNFEILFNYAVVCFDLKNYIKSEELFKKAILINSHYHLLFNGYGLLLKELDRDEEAAENFYKSIEIKKDYLNAHLNLFNLYKKYNNQEKMIKIINDILIIKPNFPIMYHEKATILMDQYKFDEAIESIKEVFKYEVDSIENYFRLYKIYQKKNNSSKCKEIFNEVISLLKNKIKFDKNSDLYYQLSLFYTESKDFIEAEKNIKQAIEINPKVGQYYMLLGKINSEMFNFIDAKKNMENAIKINPLNENYNIIYASLLKDEFKEYEKAKKIILKFGNEKLFKNNKIVNYTKACLLLNEGNYKEGWVAHNLNLLEMKNHIKLTKKLLWKGEKLNENLLVWSGQGIGDFIFFSKIIKLLNNYAKKIIFICDKRLVPIYKRYFNKIDPLKFIVNERYEKEKFSKHIASEMLGEYFANSVDEIKKFSDEKLIVSKEWDNEINNFLINLPKNKLNIGLSWTTANQEEKSQKGIKLEQFSKLFKNKKFNFINLQFDNVENEIQDFENKNQVKLCRFKNLNLTENIDKLMSLINKLDLVVTIQNSVAHIALSIGKKTFVLLSYKPPRFYWYGPSPEQSYWYPTAKLYRQKDSKDSWMNVLEIVEKDLYKIKNKTLN
jgi:tetratricopeptide (TPR) repeat protein